MNAPEQMSTVATVSRGVIGVVMPFGGAAISLGAIEAWLRVGSLLVGIAVGLVTLHSLVKGKK